MRAHPIARLVPAWEQMPIFSASGEVAMAYRKYSDALKEPARKWRKLAEQRCAHIAELYETGRWRHYYANEYEIFQTLRESFDIARRWAAIAPEPGERAPPR